MPIWTDACATGDIDAEDVIRFDHAGRTFAFCRSPEVACSCPDGLRTHEQVDLGEGLVIDHSIECPRHNVVFDDRTGAAKPAPVCVNLKTYPARVENGRVLVEI